MLFDSGIRFRVQGSGFKVQRFRVQRFRVQGSGFRVQGSEVQGSGLNSEPQNIEY
jgi:hypothetical protein